LIRAVSFDAAGTLFMVAEPVGETYARRLRLRGLAADPVRVEVAFRSAFATAPALAFPGVTGAELERAERAWWGAIIERALGDALPRELAADVCEELFAHYAHGIAWRLDREAVATLERLKSRGLRLGVVSNFDSRLPRLLAELGLAPFFDAIVWSTGVGTAKPERAIFAALLEALGTRADETLHVGDDEHCDVAGARAAGLRALRLDPRGQARGETIARLVDLLARLD
jgi:putative hydrolase of the HAD superfamily